MKRRALLAAIAASVAMPAFACGKDRDRKHSAEATPEILAAIKALNIGVVDCGAGDGYWLQSMRWVGIDCIGYDPYPRSELVRLGDHRDAAKHTDRALMIVWPPEPLVAQEWIDLYRGPWILLCVSWPRVRGLKVPGRMVQTFETGGFQGCSTFEFHQR